MTALGKLLRTTAFRLTLVYLLVFALFAVFLFYLLRLIKRGPSAVMPAQVPRPLVPMEV